MFSFRRKLQVSMSEAEQAAISTLFQLLDRPLEVLEWGSGGSTVVLAGMLPAGSSWLSIEHQARQVSRVRRALASAHLQHVEVLHVPADAGDEADDYVRAPASRAKTFDVVLVDGVARAECLRQGWGLLRSDGALLLHGAQRPEHASARPQDGLAVELEDSGNLAEGRPAQLHFYFKHAPLAERLRRVLADTVEDSIRIRAVDSPTP